LEQLRIDTGEAVISVSRGGTGPGLLLLHGFPQTRLMWRDIAPRLTPRFTVVCADLRGYGTSGTPPSSADHAPYSKRAMARDMVSVMAQLGFEHFFVAGHDRGGRAAYRAALDHPDRVDALAVLDGLPVDVVWDRADDRLALGFWPWSLLAQPEPLPERLIGGAPDAVIANALSPEWGSPADTFDDTIRAGRRITCPLLALWSAAGPLSSWYADDGGPLALWRGLATDVTGEPVDGGHFFPEERPGTIADKLSEFFLTTNSS
jgi:haloacetate dehalogenase